MSKYKDIIYLPNKKKFKIEGSWAKYIDPPNVIYYFYKNGIYEEKFVDYEEPPTIIKGRYTFDGCCKIKIVRDDGKQINIDVISIDGRITLKEKCFIFDPEYYSKELRKQSKE